MGSGVDILRGELERLFTVSNLDHLVRAYLGVDPAQIHSTDDTKAVFVRKLMDFCQKNDAVEALADIVLYLKKGMVDPRLRQVFEAATPLPPDPNTSLGGFRAAEHLHESSLGSVFRAVPESGASASEPWMVEVLSRDSVLEPGSAWRFLTSQRMYMEVENPHLLAVKHVGLLPDGRPYRIVPKLAGKMLSEMKPMPIRDLAPLMDQVLDGLEALHQKGLVHGDVKPENIVVTSIGEDRKAAVLCGFGMEKLRTRKRYDAEHSGRISLIGTPKVMAPEQARGSDPDSRTDLYGVGATLYEVLTGRALFFGHSPIDVLSAQLSKDPERPSAVAKKDPIPPELDDILLRALHKEPARRFADAGQLKAALHRVLEMSAKAPTETGTYEDIAPAVELFLENPADEGLLDQLEEEARERKAWRPAAEVILKAADALVVEETKKTLLFRVARIYETEIQEPASAEKVYRKILEIDPEDPIAEAGLAELQKGTGRYEEVIEMLSDRVGKTEDREEKLSILEEIASLYEKDAKDYSKAFDIQMLLHSEGRSGPDRMDALERLAEKTNRWSELVQAASALLRNIPDPNVHADLCLRLGRWYLDQLSLPDYALPCFQQVLASRPGDPLAVEAVLDLYRSGQKWPELAQSLAAAAETETVPSKRRDRMVEAARIQFEKLHAFSTAKTLLERVVEDDPSHEEALDLFEKIYNQSEDWPKLALLYERRLNTAPESEIVPLRFRLAELYEIRLKDLENARESYKDVVSMAPDHLEALKGLERIFALKEDYTALLENLKRQVDLIATPRQKIQLHERLAGLYEEEFKDPTNAIDSYETVLDLDPANGAALAALTRLYRKEQKWEDLARILLARAEIIEKSDEKIDLLKSLAQLYEEKLQSTAKAAEILGQVAKMTGKDEGTLDALARSQEESHDWTGLIHTLEQLVDATDNKVTKSSILLRMARVQDTGLCDLEASIASLRKAVDLAPDNGNALSALREAYLKRGDYSNALEMHQRELKITDGDLARAEVIAEMGYLCQTHLGDEDRAIEYYELALNLDPNCLKAADNVCALYRARNRWSDALDIYERFYQSIDALPHEMAIDLLTRMGEAVNRLGNPERALAIFAQARQRAGDDPYLIRSLGKVAFAVDNAEEARKSFTEFLEKFGDRATTEERVEALVMKAKSLLRLGGREGEALQSARQAVTVDPSSSEARRLVADIYLSTRAWRDAVEAKRKLIEILKDPREKLSLLLEIGQIESEQLRDNPTAVSTLTVAHAIDPANREVLHQLMKVHSAMGQWSQVVEVVLKIADLIEDKKQLAKYYLTVGKIYRRELNRPEEALTYVDMALEEDPTLLGAFENMVQIHTDAQQWNELERAYRKMLGRLPPEFDLQTRVNLWHSLSELYIHRLQRTDDAIIVLETIRKLVPDEKRWMEELSDLYGWEAKYSERAIALHHELLRVNPLRVESFRGLRRIYSEEKRPDEAWCVSQVLSLLRAADQEELSYYREFRPDDLSAPSRSLEQNEWTKYLHHPNLDPLVTSIFALIQNAILSEKAQPHKSFGLKPDDAVDTDKDPGEFSQLVKFACGALGLKPPAIFYDKERPIGFAFAHTTPPSLVVGQKALGLSNRKGTAFTLAQYLTYAIPGFYVRQLLTSGTEMGAWLLAAIKIFVPQLPAPKDQVAMVTDALAVIKSRLDKTTMDKLRDHVQSFVAGGGEVNLKRWGSAVDLTVDRAGLVLIHDLDAAIRCLNDLPDSSSALSLKDRIKELTLFSISEPYFSLRRHMGVALEPG